MTDFAARRTTMVDTQVRPSDVTKYPIIQAMLSVPREDFVPTRLREMAYIGENLDLDDARVILEPRTFAKMLDALDLGDDELVLDIGAAGGYSAAVLSRIAQAVVAVEENADMTSDIQESLMSCDADNVLVHEGALTAGAPEHGPYDAIVIEGAVAQVPEALAAQLKDGGRIVALFADGALGEARIGYKIDGRISWRMLFNAGAPVLPGFEKELDFQL